MNAVLHDIGRGLWRLVPANPIVVRVVHASSRRTRHLWIRCAYLAVLTVVVVIGVLLNQPGRVASLSALAKSAAGLFEVVSILQLAMVCVLAPIFAAGAITQEKDSETYNILLATPLSDAQIVFGSLLSRLYFILVLLMASVPLFCIMMVYGGVTGYEIGQAIGIAAAAATVTASVAIAVSVIRIGTGRTIFSFYLAIALYLMALWTLSDVPFFIAEAAQPAPGQSARMSWLAPFHPFLSLWVVLGRTPAPEFGAVAARGFPTAYLLAYPQFSFIVLSLVLSLVLVCVSVFFVRRGTRVGELTWLGRLTGRERFRETTAAGTRRPRHVWSNPVAWREAVTKAAAGAGGTVRMGVAIGSLVAALWLLIAYARGLAVDDARLWLEGLVGLELGLAMFIATATAATSMTREKEANTLDLLLTTPIQSHRIIWGKLLGLVSFAAPMIAVPIATLGLFIVYDLLSGRLSGKPGGIVHPEIVLTLPMVSIAYLAFACMIGLRASIQHRRTVTAVLTSVALVVFIFALPASCSFASRATAPWLTASLTPLSPLPAVMFAIAPEPFLATGAQPLTPDEVATYRWIAAGSSLITTLLYGLVGWWLYRQMVHSFDMVIRKQTT